MILSSKVWRGRKHYLDKMTLGQLIKAYLAYPAIQVYLLLGAVCTYLALALRDSVPPMVLAVLASLAVYGLVWYLLHRFVLHGRFLYRSPRTAALWKRVHFDHHRDPNDLRVLFGALYTTLPTVFVVTVPVGWLIGGPAGSAAAFATALFVTCFYEFCHCIQHMSYTPKLRFLRRVKKLHLAHHYHNEQGNYGITNFFWDRVFGTYYEHPRHVARSPTVFNLGYTDAEGERYPWVAERSAGEMPAAAGEREGERT